MSKKTFLSLLGLMLGAGVLALGFFVIGSRQPQKNAALAWKTQPYSSAVYQLDFYDDGMKLLSDGDEGAHVWDARSGRLLATLSKKSLTSAERNRLIAPRLKQKFVLVRQPGVLAKSIVYPWRDERGRKRFDVTNLFRSKSLDVIETQTSRLLCRVPMPDDQVSDALIYQDKTLLSPDKNLLLILLQREAHFQGRLQRVEESELWNITAGKRLWRKVRSVGGGEEFSPKPEVFFIDNQTVVRVAPSLERIAIHSTEPELHLQRNDTVFARFPAKAQLPPHLEWPPTWTPFVISPDRRFAVSAARMDPEGYLHTAPEGLVFCWDFKSKRVLWTWREDTFAPKHFLFSPDGKTLAIRGRIFELGSSYQRQGRLLLFDPRDGRIKSTLREETSLDNWNRQWTDRKTRADRTRTAWLEKIVKKAPPKTVTRQSFAPGDSGEITALQFSPDSKTLAAGYADGSIKLWRVPQK